MSLIEKSTGFRLLAAVICMVAILASNTAVAKNPPTQRASAESSAKAVIEREMRERGIPGLQYAIIKKRRVVESGSMGIANIEDQIPVSDSTLFWINSCTKAFVGVAILQLVEDGKIDLSKPVANYVKDLPDSWSAVTVAQILSHTSGLPQIMDANANLIAGDMASAWEAVKTLPIESKPGTQFSYNQTGYYLLGKIIEHVSGQPFDRYIIQHQLKPLGMNRTTEAGFVDSNEVVSRSARVYTYTRSIDGVEVKTEKLHPIFEEFAPPMRTAAGMQSTALELAKWLIALQDGTLLHKPDSLDRLWTPARLTSGKTAGFSDFLNGYALGWPTIVRAEHPAVGSVGGGRAAFFVYRKDDLAVVILTNLRGASPEIFIDDVAAAAF